MKTQTSSAATGNCGGESWRRHPENGLSARSAALKGSMLRERVIHTRTSIASLVDESRSAGLVTNQHCPKVALSDTWRVMHEKLRPVCKLPRCERRQRDVTDWTETGSRYDATGSGCSNWTAVCRNVSLLMLRLEWCVVAGRCG